MTWEGGEPSSAAACVSELLTDCGAGSSGGRSLHYVPVNQPSLETATLACLAWENLENHREGLAGTLAEMGRGSPGPGPSPATAPSQRVTSGRNRRTR